MAKGMKKIAHGRVREEGKVWFGELADKRTFVSFLYCEHFKKHIVSTERSTKVHLYYCMKNCGGSASKLQASILNIVQHYQVQ